MSRNAAAITAMGGAAVLTMAATAAAYVDRASGHRLADHIRDGYPAYSQAQVDHAVTTYLVILTVATALGVLGWGAAIWAVSTRRSWARWAAVAMLVVWVALVLVGLLTKDTSGEVGLAPLLAWLQALPLLPGVAAVVLI